MSFNPIKPLQLKNKNFQQVTIIQILLIFFVLTIGDITASFHTAFADSIVTSGLLILEAIYLLMLLQLAKFLRPQAKSNQLVKIIIGCIFVISIIALNPFIEIVNNKVPWLIATHVLLCSIECYVIALGLMDIYSSDIHISERLWGSTAMYLMIGLGWASFYEILVLFTNNALGPELIAGYQSYSESLYFSLCSLSGTPCTYTEPDHVIRNLSLLEGIWGVLFLVMLIGRLFTLPGKEN